MKKKTLGVLGGMGPAASARFYSLITEFTKAESDQEHIKTFLFITPDIPDRTSFILGKSRKDPLPDMKKTALALAKAGADIIAVPCNTAAYFHADLQKACPIPILNTVYTAAEFAADRGVKKLGILATEGTVCSKIYQQILAEYGIAFALPSQRSQVVLNEIIYDRIKKALAPKKEDFLAVATELASKGCDAIVLGCTELSLIPMEKDDEKYNFIDSLYTLAKKSIECCGYEVRT